MSGLSAGPLLCQEEEVFSPTSSSLSSMRYTLFRSICKDNYWFNKVVAVHERPPASFAKAADAIFAAGGSDDGQRGVG